MPGAVVCGYLFLGVLEVAEMWFCCGFRVRAHMSMLVKVFLQQLIQHICSSLVEAKLLFENLCDLPRVIIRVHGDPYNLIFRHFDVGVKQFLAWRFKVVD